MADFYILKVDSFFIKSSEELTDDVFSAYKFPSIQLNQACSYRDKINKKLNSDSVKVAKLSESIQIQTLMNIENFRGCYA